MQITVKSAKYSVIQNNDKMLISEIMYPLSKNGDTIFGLIKILGKPDNTRIRLAETIEDRLHNFKDTLKGNVNVPHRFEQLLQALNEDISTVMSEEKQVPLSDLHAIIGVIHENQIFLSGIGNLGALFMHKSAKQRYVIYELEKQFQNEEISWDKLFSSILDGELNFGDIFYISTKISPREIATNEIQDILTTLPPAGALKRIQQHLNIDTSFGALCFKILDKQVTNTLKKVNPIASIQQLEETHDKTEVLLTAQKPNFKKWITEATNPLLQKLSSNGNRGIINSVKQIIRLLLHSIIAILTMLIAISKFIFNLTKKLAKHTPILYNTIKKLISKSPNIKKLTQEKIQTINDLPRKIKYSGIGIIVIIILLASGLTILSAKSNSQKQNTLFENMVARIIEKEDAAEASLIYDNKEQARELIDEATELLNTLPIAHKANEETVKQLSADIANITLKIQGIEYVNPDILANLSTINDNANCISINEINNIVYCVNNDNSLYRLNELDKTFELVTTTSGSIGMITKGATGENNILFIDSKNTLGKINIENQTINPTISGTDKLTDINGLTEYNNNLYVLSGENQQIIKMQPRGNGYDAGTNWIKSVISNIKNAKDLAIDGDVFVLMPNKILKFTSGNEQTFDFETITPQMNNAVDIWTDINSQYIYILDNSEGRIIVYDKNGKLIAQYMNDKFKNGVNMIIREDKKIILIGTNTEVLSFSASHLLR